MTCEHEIDWRRDALVVETSSVRTRKYLEVFCRKCGAIGEAEEQDIKKIVKWKENTDVSQPAPSE